MRKLFVMGLMLVTSAAFADFLPGKERKVASAKMQVVRASGIYADLREVSLEKIHVDGKGFARLVLSAGPHLLHIPMNKFEATFCGNFSWSKELIEGASKTRVAFSDYSNIRCRMRVDEAWKLDIQTIEASGFVSILELEGTPKYFMQTM
jgi:hypothetical protein